MNDEEETIKVEEYLDPPVDYQNTIKEIEETAFNIILESIINGKQPSDMSKKILKINAMVFQKSQNYNYRHFLYQYYKNKIIEFTQSYSSENLKNKIGKELLSEFISQWEKAKLLIYWMKRIFEYLDKAYLIPNGINENQELASLSITGLNIFFVNIFKKFCKQIINQIFHEIESERDGNLVDWDRIQKVILCYRKIGMKKGKIIKEDNEITWIGTENLQYYSDFFEPQYIKHAIEYYKNIATLWFHKQSVPEYVNSVLSAFKHEEDKISKYLDTTTFAKVNEKLIQELIVEYDEKLANQEDSGCSEMFKNNKLNELKSMYILFSKHPKSYDNIINKMKPYIISRAENISENKDLQKDAFLFISEFSKLKEQFSDMLSFCFEKNILFSNAIDLSMSKVVRNSVLFPQ